MFLSNFQKICQNLSICFNKIQQKSNEITTIYFIFVRANDDRETKEVQTREEIDFKVDVKNCDVMDVEGHAFVALLPNHTRLVS